MADFFSFLPVAFATRSRSCRFTVVRRQTVVSESHMFRLLLTRRLLTQLSYVHEREVTSQIFKWHTRFRALDTRTIGSVAYKVLKGPQLRS